MTYQVLARKWRPRTFQEIVGQEHILRMLENALSQKRIHHAYLFTGTRGVGKTTLARILAKCLNCESGIVPTPCGTCKACLAIDAGKFLDLYEVDAASRTKVEDTRDLLDTILYPPSQGRYKIYLIDEVHMLSNHSFNALLKTLEEPPEHIKFLLATTEAKRLPITILSRCLQFHLKRITPEQITAHLQHICSQEKVNYDLEALKKLAQAAQGSMRDALSLLDQAIAYGKGNVSQNDVQEMLGCIIQEDLLPILKTLGHHDGKALWKAFQELADRMPNFYQVLEEFISIFHKIAVEQIIPGALEIEESIASLVQDFSPEQVQLYYQIALLGRRDLSLAPTPQQGMEMTMLRMFAFKPHSLDAKTETPPTHGHIESRPIFKEKSIPLDVEKEKQDVLANENSQWRDILSKLKLTGMSYALASNCSLAKLSENKIELVLSVNHEPMLNTKLKERLTSALTHYFKKPMQLEIHVSSSDLPTPRKEALQEEKQKLDQATQTILEDPNVKQLIDMYGATVEVSLINPQ